LLVENKVVIEIKSVEALNDIHLAQTLTYLKLGNFRLGLLINFNVLVPKTGMKLLVASDGEFTQNTHPPSPSLPVGKVCRG